jgi:AraC-like DNA-binding protein
VCPSCPAGLRSRDRESVGPRLLIAPSREAHRPQVVEKAVHGDGHLASNMTWAMAHLDEPISIEALARHAHMSVRTYLRRFTATMGTSPIQWLITQRMHASLLMLENTQLSVEQVAARVGFNHAVTFRYHFGRMIGTSPTAYLSAFIRASETGPLAWSGKNVNDVPSGEPAAAPEADAQESQILFALASTTRRRLLEDLRTRTAGACPSCAPTSTSYDRPR